LVAWQVRLGKLSMALVRHTLRGQSHVKLDALPHVPALLGLLVLGWGASDCLMEMFTDNEMVDRVPDGTISMFVDLLRTRGRDARYVRFLEVLCTCRGKAVRVNQWRIASMLLEGAPRMLLRLSLQPDGRVMVAGDVEYFPKLAEHGGQLELGCWLGSTAPQLVEYFERCGHPVPPTHDPLQPTRPATRC
jgi:hypothetical protein